MAPARLLSLGLGAVLLAGCRPAEPASVEPGAAVAAVAEDDATLDDVEDTAESEEPRGGGDDGFVLRLESRCRDVWNGNLVRAEVAPEPPRSFEVKNAVTHELRMWPGDALVLTTPHGGIMALEFDNMTTGYAAHVEVTSGCTGVKRTVVRQAGI